MEVPSINRTLSLVPGGFSLEEIRPYKDTSQLQQRIRIAKL